MIVQSYLPGDSSLHLSHTWFLGPTTVCPRTAPQPVKPFFARVTAVLNIYFYMCALQLLLLLLHLFNGLFSRTTWVSRYQKGKISLDLNEARDHGDLGWQWRQPDRMQIICTPLQTTTSTRQHSIFTSQRLFLTPNQQCQSTEGIVLCN